MTGLRSQRSMKRGSTPTPVCSELRLFSREAITLKIPGLGGLNERNRDVTPNKVRECSTPPTYSVGLCAPPGLIVWRSLYQGCSFDANFVLTVGRQTI
jgi:hypothetical protein